MAIGIPTSVTNFMQNLGIALTNRFLLPYGSDKVAAMGIVMNANLIAVLVLVGFAFGAQPLIGYNYGAGNRERLKQVLSFCYRFECAAAVVLTITLSPTAQPRIALFVPDSTVIEVGVPMLRMQQVNLNCVSVRKLALL